MSYLTAHQPVMSELNQRQLDKKWMTVALDLARSAPATVSPNPGVGAVIVHGNTAIGTGATQVDGGPHAEILALRGVPDSQAHLLPASTLYVSLEPCSIYGRTPPCVHAIVEAGIKRVVVGCLDFTPGVCGQGLEYLRHHGIEVLLGVEQQRALFEHRHRHVFVRKQRPYITLKQARSRDNIVGVSTRQLRITGDEANTESHRWRASHDAILIGIGTALSDDPALSVRHIQGKQPLRILLDPSGRAPRTIQLFQDGLPTLYVVGEAAEIPALPAPVELLRAPATDLIQTTLDELYRRRVGRLLVEGGPTTTSRFLAADAFDELREWVAPHLFASEPQAVAATDFSHLEPTCIGTFGQDQLFVGYRKDEIWSLKSS